MIRNLARCLLISLLAIVQASASGLQPFSVDSLAQIEQRYAGRPYLVSIWSLECPPCMAELALFSQLRRQYPGFNLVLISTDGPDLVTEVQQTLAEYQLTDVDVWIFSEQQPERLRYSIDPLWYGELPRSYLYENGQRQSHSGLISEAWLASWLDGQ